MSASEQDPFARLAAMIEGDRWLTADGCAAFLGGIKRRTFLEEIACKPDFPMPAKVQGPRKLWRKSEVDDWVEMHRSSRAA